MKDFYIDIQPNDLEDFEFSFGFYTQKGVDEFNQEFKEFVIGLIFFEIRVGKIV